MADDNPTGPRLLEMPKQLNQSAAFADQFERDLPFLMRNAINIAKLRKCAYDAYVLEGFTPEQALTLCRS